MRISDWSSDVCSSDLRDRRHPVSVRPGQGEGAAGRGRLSRRLQGDVLRLPRPALLRGGDQLPAGGGHRGRSAVPAMAGAAAADRRRQDADRAPDLRSEEHTSELQSLMRISYAVFCLKKKKADKENKEPVTTKRYK